MPSIAKLIVARQQDSDLCICSILEGIEYLLQSYNVTRFPVPSLPHHAICLQNNPLVSFLIRCAHKRGSQARPAGCIEQDAVGAHPLAELASNFVLLQDVLVDFFTVVRLGGHGMAAGTRWNCDSRPASLLPYSYSNCQRPQHQRPATQLTKR